MKSKELAKKLKETIRGIKKENKKCTDEQAACIIIAHSAVEKAIDETTKDKKHESIITTVGVMVALFGHELKINITNQGLLAIGAMIEEEAKERNLKDMELKLPTREEILKARAIGHHKDALAGILYNFDQIKERDPVIKLVRSTIDVVEDILFNEFSKRSIINDFLDEMPTFISDNLQLRLPENFYDDLENSIRFSMFIHDAPEGITVKEVLAKAKKDHPKTYCTFEKLGLNPNDDFRKAMEAVKESATKQTEVKRKRPRRKISLSEIA